MSTIPSLTPLTPIGTEEAYVTDGLTNKRVTLNAIAALATAGAGMDADYNANTILAATVDDTPAPLTIAEQTVIGRITGGNIVGLTSAQIRTLLSISNVENFDLYGTLLNNQVFS